VGCPFKAESGELMEKIAAYIDGYNLYHSLKENGWRKYYWLNIAGMLQSFIRKDQYFSTIKYFTSPSHDQASHKRQITYIEAMQTQALVEMVPFSVIFGRFEPKPVMCDTCNDFAFCKECGERLSFSNEKETDVNIAVNLLSDAYEDQYDTAFLVTADSDQVGTIKKIKELFFSSKKVGIIYPPGRDSRDLNRCSDFQLHINQSVLGKNQLPEKIIKAGGYSLMRPEHWC
jgi:uncharacterized LabA/DUF88 family protein